MQRKDGSPYLMEKPSRIFYAPIMNRSINFGKNKLRKYIKPLALIFIYHDWANLIEVPPCYNPLHKHKSPLSSYWNMSGQYKIMYEKVQSIKPGYAIEMCECGRPHDPYKMPYYNITNASDATSKEQVMQRLKVEKALNGSKTYFNPGYVLPERPRKTGTTTHVK